MVVPVARAVMVNTGQLDPLGEVLKSNWRLAVRPSIPATASRWTARLGFALDETGNSIGYTINLFSLEEQPVAEQISLPPAAAAFHLVGLSRFGWTRHQTHHLAPQNLCFYFHYVSINVSSEAVASFARAGGIVETVISMFA